VTDPFSTLTPPVTGGLGEVGPIATESTIGPGACTIDALAGLGDVEVFGSFSFETARVGSSCYGDGEQAFVTATRRDDGALVAIGGTLPFTNEYLGDADNAALIAAVLAPVPGREVVLLQDAPTAGTAGGVDSPFDLVDRSVVLALVQLGIAFVLYALWRARRLGRPLREPQPVAIEGSELVAAVGDLLHRTGDPQRAARLLRDDTRRELGERLGLPREAPIETLAATASTRTGVDADRVTLVLSTMVVTTDDELLALGREIESLRQEILHEPAL
jgi:hypothetical protein